jgi:transposase
LSSPVSFAQVEKFQRTNIIAGLCDGKIVAPFEFKGTTDAVLFESWFEAQLLPNVKRGSVIVMDNASIHRKSVLFDMAEEYRCTLVFLPAYSPDLNPIEFFWGLMKKFLRDFSHKFCSLADALMNIFRFK